MPFADPKKRRAYNTQYKRRRRQGKTKSTRQIKAYICPHIPFLRIGHGVQFENAFLLTDRIEDQVMIEAHTRFGKHIFKISLDLSGIPVANE